MAEQPLFEQYLFVTPEGLIKGDSRHRADDRNFETWKCAYFERSFQVAMVYPKTTDARTLRIPDDAYQALRSKRMEYIGRKSQTARHEAGHAILFHALRLAPVEIDIRLGARPGGNLHAQLKRNVAYSGSIWIIGGSMSPMLSHADRQTKLGDTRYLLGLACQGFGGSVACPGDQSGVDGDLAKIREEVEQLVSAASRSVVALFAPTPATPVTPARLETRLRSLAEEIMSDPLVAERHEKLAKQLAEKEHLTQEEVEAIVEPDTLPDYSNRLEEIRKEFRLPEKY